MQTNFGRFSLYDTPRIFWIRDILSVNQKHLRLFSLARFDEFSWSWILEDQIQVLKVFVCLRPL